MIAALHVSSRRKNLPAIVASTIAVGLCLTTGCSIAPFGSDSSKNRSSSTDTTSSSSGGTNGGASGDTSGSFPAAGGTWGQSIATELFQTPDPSYDKSTILGLYQVSTSGDSLSPIRVRIAADHVAVAFKSASGDVVGVSVSIQLKSDDSVVFLEGAEAVNGSPCMDKRVKIALAAGTGYLSRDPGGEGVSGHLPLTVSSGSCAVGLTGLLESGIFEQSISLVQIGK